MILYLDYRVYDVLLYDRVKPVDSLPRCEAKNSNDIEVRNRRDLFICLIFFSSVLNILPFGPFF